MELQSKFYQWLSFYEACGIKFDITKRTDHHCVINGVNVQCFGSNVATGQGFSGNVVMDEHSLYANAQELYDSLLPTVSLGHKLRIVGRPHGVNNLFWKIKEGLTGYQGFSRHETDIYKAVKAGLKVNIEEIRSGGDLDAEAFDEQYLCIPRDESTAYFPYELINQCIGDMPESLDGEFYITIDIGRSNDKSALIVYCKHSDNKYYVNDLKELSNVEYSQQELIMGDYIDKYKPKRVIIDKGLNGMLVEALTKTHGKKIEGVIMNDKLKTNGFQSLKKLFEDKGIVIPAEDKIIDQLHSVKRDTASGGVIKFTAPRSSKGHNDFAFSMCLLGEVITTKKVKPKMYLGKR